MSYAYGGTSAVHLLSTEEDPWSVDTEAPWDEPTVLEPARVSPAEALAALAGSARLGKARPRESSSRRQVHCAGAIARLASEVSEQLQGARPRRPETVCERPKDRSPSPRQQALDPVVSTPTAAPTQTSVALARIELAPSRPPPPRRRLSDITLPRFPTPAPMPEAPRSPGYERRECLWLLLLASVLAATWDLLPAAADLSAGDLGALAERHAVLGVNFLRALVESWI